MREKERANFCDFFEAKPNVFKKPQSAASSQAMEKLQELFGIKAAVETKPLTNDDVESLFSKPKPKKTKDKKK